MPDRRSPLDAAHRALGAKMVPFSGWEMPLSYPSGTLAEHRTCRTGAVAFDVSHLGTVRLDGAGAYDAFPCGEPEFEPTLPYYGFQHVELAIGHGAAGIVPCADSSVKAGVSSTSRRIMYAAMMTTMLHNLPSASAFDVRRQVGELSSLVGAR